MGSKILVGVFMCVFARVSLRPSITRVSSRIPIVIITLVATTVATGLLGMMGNKGGVGIRMEINNSSLCFLCAHMAAHREKVSERNAEFHRILTEMTFVLPSEKEAEHLHLLSHDVVYWVAFRHCRNG